MKTTINRFGGEFMTLEEFAERHDLEMVVTERTDPKLPQWYAHFKDVEIMINGMLEGAFENGAKIEDAISNYRVMISRKRIVVNAGDSIAGRREIDVPLLKESEGERNAL